MTEKLRPARVSPPGAILKRELEARGWTQKDLAAIIGRPEQAISEIINGEKRIIAETAISFAQAFGTSAELWLNLQSNFDLWQAERKQSPAGETEIQRKAKLYERAPVAELIKRGWIKKAQSLAVLEREFCRFFGITSPDDMPRFAASFRHSEVRAPEVAAQMAWLARVDQVAHPPRSRVFRRASIRAKLPELLTLSSSVELAAKALEWVSDQGIAVALVRHLPKTFMDGVAYVRPDGTPVIGLTLRYDRVDAFWFTLLHELAHLVLGHQGAHLDDLTQTLDVPDEREANDLAQRLLVPEAEMAQWLERHPRPTKAAIVVLAAQLRRDPGIVLGHLQHRQLVPYSHHRPLLRRVSEHVGSWLAR